MTLISKKKLFSLLFWLIPLWFLTDNVLGTNGYQLTVGGISIRILLFCLTGALLGGYCLAVLFREKISLLPRKNGAHIFSWFRPTDFAVLIFLGANVLWATVIPRLVRGDGAFALKDFSTLLVLALYFPLVFLIRTGRLRFDRLEDIFYGLTVLLALWHCVMYVGDVLSPGFYASYYDFIDFISFGTAVRTDVIYGFGVVRIIQVTSVFLLPGIFLSVRKILQGKRLHYAALFLFVFAICATFTKSIWIGAMAGLGVFLGLTAIFVKDKKIRLRVLSVLLVTVVLTVGLNFLAFDGDVGTRMFNLAGTQTTSEELQEMMAGLDKDSELYDELQNQLKDLLGTMEANSIRARQNAALFAKWKQSPLVGFGYGAYAEDCIRNDAFPYMYESTLPALMLKIGILGLGVWVLFILFVSGRAVSVLRKRDPIRLFLWLATGLSYGLAVQTNPYLFTFAGISVLLYLLISLSDKINDSEA